MVSDEKPRPAGAGNTPRGFVRRYPRFKPSFRGRVEMMAERGLSMAHTTTIRWVHHYAPEFERRRNLFARSARGLGVATKPP
jgi:transposase-like protein